MLRAIERGLSLNDLNEMTIGAIIGYIVEYDNERLDEDDMKETIREATQADFDRW